MNKKIMITIISVLVIILGGALIYCFNNQRNLNNNIENNESNGNIKEETNSNESVDNGENNDDTKDNDTTSDKKVLVLYFSMSGNTETVANYIHDEVGGDIVKLETVQTYPSNYNDLVDYAQEEQRKNARPELKTKVNIDDYDTIFLGYPNWWSDMPMPIYTFLDNYDLSGKTIAPFITHGGSGLSGTPSKIQNEEPNAKVTEGLAVSGSSAKSSKNTVTSWLNRIGY